MLARFYNIAIKDISHLYYSERNELREKKVKMVKDIGLNKLMFISEGGDFGFIWNITTSNSIWKNKNNSKYKQSAEVIKNLRTSMSS